jgi:acetyl-CoA carboxylase carboxyl transferase subunit beta
VPLHPLQTEWDAELRAGDPLGFPAYGGGPDRESVLTGRTEHYALIEGRFDVLGGSMGAAHGERVVRAFRRATEAQLPVVVLTASGGARMQEGMVSLIQMARTAAASADHAEAGLLSVGVFRSPTTGGVYASYGSLCAIRAAVVGAIVGFAGPRVVEQTTGQPLPPDSHTAESAFACGLVDALVADDEAAQRAWVEAALGLGSLPPTPAPGTGREGPVPATVPDGAWGEVLRARDRRRLAPVDLARGLCDSWIELRGVDTAAAAAAVAAIGPHRVVVLTLGREAPVPSDYRLMQRAIALAGRLGLRLVTFVDTRGADPSPSSEGDGVAAEIARTLAAMATLPTASVAVCTGEGGSGGALAVAAADHLLMLEHSIFSVIAPEGAAAILHRDAGRAPEITESLKLTARDLVEMGIADAIVPEGETSAETISFVKVAVAHHLAAAQPGQRRQRLDAVTARALR